MFRKFDGAAPSSPAGADANAAFGGLSQPLQGTARPAVTASVIARAQAAPLAPAIIEVQRTWSYGELLAASAGVAAAIAEAGPEPGAVIALTGPRGFSLIAGMLGILLSGCAVLPLEPAAPRRWRENALRESSAALLLACGGDLDLATELPVVTFDARNPALSGKGARPEVMPRRGSPGPADPAYLFFTSGTTGRPKGVLGSHGALAHFIHWQATTFAVGPGDRVAHVTGLSFDVVLREIFLPLTSGAALCVPSSEAVSDPRLLMAWLHAAGVTLLHAVPTLANAWLTEADPGGALPRLRATFFAGEPLTGALVERWRRVTGSAAQVINLYGPTETTLAKCWYEVPRESLEENLPVGRPLPETQVLVVSPQGTPCRHGEPGEVVIRTPWRSLGYINAPSPFRSNPFRDDPEDCLYMTGDRGWFGADGRLRLLGRIDDQVKIRGVRVEPAGIAALLARHPEVVACTVLPVRRGAHLQLAAFVVSSAARAELRGYLAGLVADAMVPAEFHLLAELPRNRNGKVDRAALLELAGSSPAVAGAAAAPEPKGHDQAPVDGCAGVLAAIVREVLGLPSDRQIHPDDDFFDLGGDSLLALSLVSRVNQQLGVSIDVGDLFEEPRITPLARRLEALSGRLMALPRPLVPVARGGEHLLSPAQQRIWFQCQLEGEGAISYNVPVAVELDGDLSVPALHACLDDLAARHEALRSRFVCRDGVPHVEIAPVAPVPLAFVDLSGRSWLEQTRRACELAEQQATRPFLLDREMLLRGMLLRLGPRRHILHLTVHHLVFDGWSRWLLFGELGRLYAAFSKGMPSPLAAQQIQYVDFAAWARAHLQRQDGIAYWRKTLAGTSPLLLETDRPRPGIPSFAGADVGCVLPQALVEALEQLARSERATLYMVLLAAYQVLLARWSGQPDITVGSPVANRPHPELEPLLGCFIETLPMRTDLAGSLSFRDALKRGRETVLGAFVNADVPFEKIVAALKPVRAPGRHPFFDVMFNLVSVPGHPPDLEGLTFAFPELAPLQARFDLTLYARKQGGDLALRLVYQTALFDAGRMERFMADYASLLEQVAANPDGPVATPGRGAAGSGPAGTRPAPSLTEEGESCLPAAPRTATERTLAAVLADLLGRESLSIHDNFFALGGHSLLAAQAVSRLRRALAVTVPLRLLFEHQTVAAMAAALDGAANASAAREAISAGVSCAQKRILEYLAANPGSPHYNVPRKVMLRGELDAGLLEDALRQVVERHDILRTVYPEPQGRPRVGKDWPFVLDRCDLSDTADPPGELEALTLAEINRPFDLARGPALRATLARMGADEHALLVSVHHVNADCWSMGMPFGEPSVPARAWMAGVFFREVWDCYRAAREGRGCPLSPPMAQYAEIVASQEAWLAGEDAARQLRFWTDLLADAPPPLEVPPEYPRPARWDFAGERLPLHISAAQTAALRRLAAGEQTTLFVVLHAVFAVLLRKWSGSDDQVVGTTASNRAHWQAEELIGFFSNNLTLRTDLSGVRTFREVVRRASSSAFTAFSHQELPFERILQALGVGMSEDRHPLFQVRFLMHHPQDDAFASETLRLVPVATGREVAKYDLSLLLADHGEVLEGWLEYATSLYSRDMMQRMLGDFLGLVEAFAVDPDRRIEALRGCRG